MRTQRGRTIENKFVEKIIHRNSSTGTTVTEQKLIKNPDRKRRIDNLQSPFRGVSFHAASQKWRARLKLNGTSKHLGYFMSDLKAARAYNRACRELQMSQTMNDEVEELELSSSDDNETEPTQLNPKHQDIRVETNSRVSQNYGDEVSIYPFIYFYDQNQDCRGEEYIMFPGSVPVSPNRGGYNQISQRASHSPIFMDDNNQQQHQMSETESEFLLQALDDGYTNQIPSQIPSRQTNQEAYYLPFGHKR